MTVNKQSLLKALTAMFDKTVCDADFEVELLNGGTVGEVNKIYGTAVMENSSHPFELVLKIQRKWERHGDPGCWRREFEIYKSGLCYEIPDCIKIPKCYLLEEDEDITYMWMQYVTGLIGCDQLHSDELSLAAERLGFFQAYYHLNGDKNLPYIRSYPALESSFDLWYGKIPNRLKENISGFPDALREILRQYAEKAEDARYSDSLKSLPVTLCHGDVHHDNIFLSETDHGYFDVYLIDWDSAGFGYMGEDAVDVLMEAFIYSDRDVSLIHDFRKIIIQSYCSGAKKGGVELDLPDSLVREIFVYAWGFRIAALYLYYGSVNDTKAQQRCIDVLSAMLL